MVRIQDGTPPERLRRIIGRAVRERYRHGLVSHTEVLDAETLGSRAT